MKVLLVEDDRLLRSVLERMLTNEKLDVVAAETVLDATAHLNNLGPFDLVIVDYDLPEGRGTSIVTEARRLNPGGKILGMSGGFEAEGRMLDVGVDWYQKKPFSLAHFRELIKTWGVIG